LPEIYNPKVASPLLILLHNYGSSGENLESYLRMKQEAAANGIIYLAPDGMIDDTKRRFWKATDACCDFRNYGQDDSSYIISLID